MCNLAVLLLELYVLVLELRGPYARNEHLKGAPMPIGGNMPHS